MLLQVIINGSLNGPRNIIIFVDYLKMVLVILGNVNICNAPKSAALSGKCKAARLVGKGGGSF